MWAWSSGTRYNSIHLELVGIRMKVLLWYMYSFIFSVTCSGFITRIFHFHICISSTAHFQSKRKERGHRIRVQWHLFFLSFYFRCWPRVERRTPSKFWLTFSDENPLFKLFLTAEGSIACCDWVSNFFQSHLLDRVMACIAEMLIWNWPSRIDLGLLSSVLVDNYWFFPVSKWPSICWTFFTYDI